MENEARDRRPSARYFIITYKAYDVEREMKLEALSKYDAKTKFKFKYPKLEYVSCREAE